MKFNDSREIVVCFTCRAEKLIRDHKHPVTKLSFDGTKLFIPSGRKEEKERVEKALQSLQKILSVDRVDRRCNRSKCKWLQNKNLAQVEKVVGTLLQNFGFQNKDGIFLLPEETLFLLETNRIELFWNDVPVSIQRAFAVTLRSTVDLNNYRVYKTLKALGYKLTKKTGCEKRKLDDKHESEHKKPCRESSANISTSIQQNDDIITSSPQQIYNTQVCPWIYNVRLPTNDTKNEFNFFVYTNPTDTFDDCLKFNDEDAPVVTAVPFPDSVAFYRFSSVDLPIL